jgi:hypothetical protein
MDFEIRWFISLPVTEPLDYSSQCFYSTPGATESQKLRAQQKRDGPSFSRPFRAFRLFRVWYATSFHRLFGARVFTTRAFRLCALQFETRLRSFVRFCEPLGEARLDTVQSFRTNFTYRAKHNFSAYYCEPSNPNDAGCFQTRLAKIIVIWLDDFIKSFDIV